MAPGLKQSSGKGHVPLMLCPMLKSLLIEGVDPREQPGLLVLKRVVTVHALGGSPLERITFSQFQPGPGREFELITWDERFGMKIVALLHGAEPFELFI